MADTPLTLTTDVTVTCPECGCSFDVAAAVSDQAREELLILHRDEFRAEAEAEVASELADLHEQKHDLEAKLTEAREEEVDLRRQRRVLEDERKAQEQRIERMRDEIATKEREKAQFEVAREYEARLRAKIVCSATKLWPLVAWSTAPCSGAKRPMVAFTSML